MIRLMAVLAAVLLVACVGGETGSTPTRTPTLTPTSTATAAPPGEAEIGDTDVRLTLTAEMVGDVVEVSGTATVPDGALISYEVAHLEQFDYRREGQFTVTDERYSGEVHVEDFPVGEVEVWVAFQTLLGTSVDQPAEVVELYGEMGEHIAGPNVKDVGEIRRVEEATTVRR